MGAESSILEECVIDSPLSVKRAVGWVIHQATQKDGSELSVFIRKKKDKQNVDTVRLSAKHLKSLRHPGILQYVTSGKSPEGFYLVTEPVVPLELVLDELLCMEICAGLYNIIEALVFLHDKVGLSHNNISISSVFVGRDGTWKLGGLEHACRFQNITREFLDKCRALRCESAITPEEKNGWVKVDAECYHSMDSYGFGLLAEELLEHLEEISDLSKNFRLCVQDECLNLDPKLRPKFRSLLDDRLFRNNFLDISRFLKNITIKSEEEKQNFFRSVVEKLAALPEDLVAKRLTNLLFSRVVLLDEIAAKFMIPSILIPYKENAKPNLEEPETMPMFSEAVFKKYIIPELFMIFHVRERHIRLLLLKYFPHYVELFEYSTLKEVIFPHILIGLRDVDKKIVAGSLKALAEMVPILGPNVVIGGPQKQYFKEGKPKFHVMSDVIDNPKETQMNSVKDVMNKTLLKDLAVLSKNSDGIRKQEKLDGKEREQCYEELDQKRKEGLQQLIPAQTDNIVVIPPEKEQAEMSVSDEIEAELSQMPSTIVAMKQSYYKSDIELKNAVNKNFSQEELNSRNDGRIENMSADDWVAFSWDKTKHDLDKGYHIPVELNDGTRDLKNIKTYNHTNKQNDRLLGEEFDIMTIKVAKKVEEIDFFADMEPVIKSTSRNDVISSLLSQASMLYSPPASEKLDFGKNSKNSFSVSAAAAEEIADGWGNDLSWENEDLEDINLPAC